MARWIQLIALALLVSLPLAAMQAPMRAPFALAVFPPWWDAGQSLRAAAAAGRPLGLGRWTFSVVVAADRPADAGGQLRESGAWLVLPANDSTPCFTPRPKGNAL